MPSILHGANALKVLIILSVNYALAKSTGGVPVTWLFDVGVPRRNEWYEGYAFANLHSGFTIMALEWGILS